MNDNTQNQIATLQASVDALAFMVARIGAQLEFDTFPPAKQTEEARKELLEVHKQTYAKLKSKE